MMSKPIQHNPFKVVKDGFDMVFKPSEEAQICLNCDLPECKNNCKRYAEEMRKFRKRRKS